MAALSSVLADEGESSGGGDESGRSVSGRLEGWDDEEGCGLLFMQSNTEQLSARMFIPCT